MARAVVARAVVARAWSFDIIMIMSRLGLSWLGLGALTL
jgi:hypothetical protein